MKITDEAVEAMLLSWFGMDYEGNHMEEGRAALEAALPHLSQGAVRVKPLEWREVSAHGEAALVGYGLWGEFSRIPLVRNITATEIRIRQCKAEDDYERRILSTLSPAPVGVTDMADAKLIEDARLAAKTMKNMGHFPTGQSILLDLANRLEALSSHEPAPDKEPDFSRSIRKTIKQESDNGAACGWRSCTGCHETSEGAETGFYPYSTLFQCHVGSGCGECGGLGVVWEWWDTSALEEMAHEPAPTEEE